jgi:NAD+ diphosphatase
MSWPAEIHNVESEVNPPADRTDSLYFVFCNEQIVHNPDDGARWFPLPQSVWESEDWGDLTEHYMGVCREQHCFAVDLATAVTGRHFTGLRDLFDRTDRMMLVLAGRATQIIQWHKTHQFCGRCGTATTPHRSDRAKVCTECQMLFYPRLSPSIIVLIRRDTEVLLARNVRWPEGRYSTIAGFVEPGESVEETLHREVREEVGISVANIRYMGSQSWPFPNSLMLGYHADYAAGDILLQEDEIADARWFHHTNLPNIPGKTAISRWLIDAYLEEIRG